MLLKTMPLKAGRLNIGRRQQGMTMISWLAVISFILFQAILALNIMPVYITDSSISSIFSDMHSSNEARGLDPKGIRKLVLKRLKINNIYDVIKRDQIKVKKAKGFYVVNLTYEPRGTLIGNLDFIVTFNHETKIPTR